jgi:exoribonuclease R
MLVQIKDRKYTSFSYCPSFEIETDTPHPFLHKLFHGDEIIYSERDHKINIQHSPTRSAKYLAGVLNLQSNLTFGRTPNLKRLYYSCTPYKKELPIFLVPYDINLSFQKTPRNKFVLFRFDHWLNKHPYGTLVETVGDVDDLSAYYEYQLFAKYIRRKVVKLKIDFTANNSLDSYIQIILQNPERFGIFDDRRRSIIPIFSIDPQGCKDRDDALSIQSTENPNIFYISVYIANVWVWLEFFQLWHLWREMVASTVYLPDKNRHMLPQTLTETICSLDKDKPCLVIVMDFEVNTREKTILPIKITQTCIYVHNYDYESKLLLWKNTHYQLLLKVTREMDPTIGDSHDVVAYWMTQMNIHMARDLYQKKMGIFRTAKSNVEPETEQDPNPDIPFLRIWEQRISGEYVGYDSSKSFEQYAHCILDTPIYTHFTSPIRRMVDLVNQIVWVGKYDLEVNVEIIEKINRESKAIRKIQNECELLHSIQHMDITEIVEGIVLQVDREKAKYTLYLPKYKGIVSTKNREREFKKGEKVNCSLFLFQREDDTKRKIKIMLN